MRTEHGQERGVLEPAHIQFAIAHILDAEVKVTAPEPEIWIIFDEECANIDGPVRHTGRAEIQSLGNLAAQRVPGRGNVARPGDRAVTLLSGIGGTSQVDDALIRANLALPLVNPLGVQQGVSVDVFRVEIPFRFFRIDTQAFFRLRLKRSLPIGLKRFGAVAPPGVNPMREQPFVGLFPIERSCLFLKGIVGPLVAEQVALVAHFAPVVSTGIHVRPD